MPHADASSLPKEIKEKEEFWNHVYAQLEALLEGQRTWVTNCANASSLIYSSLLSFDALFGSGERAVNWCGFYLEQELFPSPILSTDSKGNRSSEEKKLLLGPFCGKPACQFINIVPARRLGVCGDAYTQKATVLVPDVEAYPGHIACDGETKSEIVCPLIYKDRAIGVLDLDCLALGGFDDQDKFGLEKIANLVVNSCDW